MKRAREQVWFASMLLIGVGAVALITYLNQVRRDLDGARYFSFAEAKVSGASDDSQDMQVKHGRFFFNRNESSPDIPHEEIGHNRSPTENSQAHQVPLPRSAQEGSRSAKHAMPEGSARTKKSYSVDSDSARLPRGSPVHGGSNVSAVDDTAGGEEGLESMQSPSSSGRVVGLKRSHKRPLGQRLAMAKSDRNRTHTQKHFTVGYRENLPQAFESSERKPRTDDVRAGSAMSDDMRPYPSPYPNRTLAGHPVAQYRLGADRRTPRSVSKLLKEREPTGRERAPDGGSHKSGWNDNGRTRGSVIRRFGDLKRLGPAPPKNGPVFRSSRHPGLVGIMDGQRDPIYNLMFAPSGGSILSGSENGLVQQWDARVGVLTRSLETGATQLLSLDTTANWEHIAILGCKSGACSLDLRDMSTGKNVGEWQIGRAFVGSVAFSPNGKYLAVGTDDGRLRLISMRTSVERTWQAHSEAIWSVAFDAYGRFIATGCLDRSVKIWDARSGELLHTLKDHDGGIHSIAFAPNGIYLATAGADSMIRIYRASTGARLAVLKGHMGTVRCLDFDPTSHRLASSGDHSIRIWDMQTHQELLSIGWDFAVTALVFSPDGTTLLAGDIVGLLTLWDTHIGLRPPDAAQTTRPD